jgi:hypothetical protein
MIFGVGKGVARYPLHLDAPQVNFFALGGGSQSEGATPH